MKRFLSHYLYIPQMGFVKRCVVEVNNNGIVSSFTPFEGESAGVVWMQGVLALTHHHLACTACELESMLLSAHTGHIYPEYLFPLLDELPQQLRGDVTSLNYTLTWYAF